MILIAVGSSGQQNDALLSMMRRRVTNPRKPRLPSNTRSKGLQHSYCANYTAKAIFRNPRRNLMPSNCALPTGKGTLRRKSGLLVQDPHDVFAILAWVSLSAANILAGFKHMHPESFIPHLFMSRRTRRPFPIPRFISDELDRLSSSQVVESVWKGLSTFNEGVPRGPDIDSPIGKSTQRDQDFGYVCTMMIVEARFAA